MNGQRAGSTVEYADAAGYPDGAGFLDEGTTPSVSGSGPEVRAIDTPSAEAEFEIRVHRLEERGLYVATIEGREIATVSYDDRRDRVAVTSTFVEPDMRGRGISAELIATALDDLRERGVHIDVECPVVAEFMRSNVQYADLLVAG
ncbi:GNAT family N-acetyltransferase [Agromyces sp. LHK192]|uniref:GNAT family N-acetyltransferase n=1 Tax=Agromyces sp. LHK192 TaxID=2498704 RepID=UPI0013E3C4D4|nr:GNAT family N-acetyltransferase [Agromyces sp. LHK192]